VRPVILDAVKGQPHTEIDWSEIELIARENAGVPIATSVRRHRKGPAGDAGATEPRRWISPADEGLPPALAPTGRSATLPPTAPAASRSAPARAPPPERSRSIWQLDPWGPGQAAPRGR
jgi:hypothetical protein